MESTISAMFRYVFVTTGSAYNSRNLCPASVVRSLLLVVVMITFPLG